MSPRCGFFVHVLGLVAGVVAFVVTDWPGRQGSRRALGGLLAAAGTVLLAIAELNTMRYADWLLDDANAGPMGSAYGLACTLRRRWNGLARVGALRSGSWSGWHRWTPLVLGCWRVRCAHPGLFLGFAAGRLAIGTWMLMYGALGWSAWAELKPTTVRDTHPAVA
jgi:hypothetical protein